MEVPGIVEHLKRIDEENKRMRAALEQCIEYTGIDTNGWAVPLKAPIDESLRLIHATCMDALAWRQKAAAKLIQKWRNEPGDYDERVGKALDEYDSDDDCADHGIERSRCGCAGLSIDDSAKETRNKYAQALKEAYAKIADHEISCRCSECFAWMKAASSKEATDGK